MTLYNYAKKTELPDEVYELLYSAASNDGFTSSFFFPEHPVMAFMLSAGLLKEVRDNRAWTHSYTLTEKGKGVLKKKKVHAIQVDFPGQPPLVLRNKEAFGQDVLGGIIDDTLDCWTGELGADDGTELFRVSIKVIDLYTLATLPEWEPI